MSHALEHHHCGKGDHSCPPAFVVLELRVYNTPTPNKNLSAPTFKNIHDIYLPPFPVMLNKVTLYNHNSVMTQFSQFIKEQLP
jgi:hypothetical protein